MDKEQEDQEMVIENQDRAEPKKEEVSKDVKMENVEEIVTEKRVEKPKTPQKEVTLTPKVIKKEEIKEPQSERSAVTRSKKKKADNVIKMEVSEPKVRRRRSTRRRSRKLLFIEYSTKTHDLRVLVRKIKGEKTKEKVYKATTLKNPKIEKPKVKEKSLKVKSRKPSVKKTIKTRVKKAPVKTPIKKPANRSTSKSSKRVLIKKISSESTGRTLRSGSRVAKIQPAVKNKSPMTRSQKKRLNSKKANTLVKSIKKG